MSLARADLIAHHDSDDVWAADKLGKQIAVMRGANGNTGIVYCGMNIHTQSGVFYYPPQKVAVKSGRVLDSLLHGNFIGSPTVLMRKELFTSVGPFDERFRHLVDYEFLLRAAQVYEFALVDEPLVEVYEQPDSVSCDIRARIQATEMILDKHRRLYTRKARLLSDIYAGLCAKAGQIPDRAMQNRFLMRAIAACPFRASLYRQVLKVNGGM
jgi:hypothetical protein